MSEKRRVLASRTKLQREYYGSDLDEPPAYYSGTWLSPLRNTNERGRGVVLEGPADVMDKYISLGGMVS